MVIAKRLMLFVIVLSGALITTNVNAESMQEYFKAGIQASATGDYSTALRHFKKAGQAGMDSVVLKYNMAVSYYRLQQYENARMIFSQLTSVSTFEQRAYFNLGLIANKQKDEPDAIRWFQRAYRDVSNKNIRLLAKEALRRLGAAPRKIRHLDSGWAGFVSSSLASDSNVTLVNSDLQNVTNESDTVVDVSVSAGRWLKGDINNGVRMSLGANMQKYSKLSQSDYSQLNARMMRYDRLADWKIRIGGSWDEVYFNGSDYQRIVSSDVRSRKELSGNKQLQLRYKLSRIQATDSQFDYLDGWRQQLRAGLQKRYGKDRVRYYYQLELNNRKDSKGAVDPFISYSPTRHTLRVTGWWGLGNKWRARLDARYRYSRYNNDDERLVNAVIQTERRTDNQVRLSAKISRKFARRWTVDGRYAYTKNDSGIDPRSYDRSVVKASVSWSF